jgi:eukaryotic-like serine/threonine-protein kinase
MHAPVPLHKLAGRYEIKEILGQGGMGLVYRARDVLIRRDVALKTLRDIPQSASLQLFYKECDVLASMSHPNIVEIFDIGEFEEEGEKKPYFVMPLLPGKTLDKVIKTESHRLTLERSVDIISQVCRGLQAAHERGLVHRDLKPSNIFVMEDDSVKIIDFGIAHMNDGHSTMGQKGTLLYMSPEQIEMKPLSASSDIFSLSVVCYEALTGRQPFRGTREEEVVAAILHQIPPPACELNPAVGRPISRVIHKGMAKQPWHRFSTARDFADTINKALRNEPIEYFDSSRLRPRLQRCTKAVEDGDYQFAGEILSELEAEGHIDTDIGLLRAQLDKAVRHKTIAQLMESAQARYEEQEDPLALQKIQDILQLDPENVTALSLKNKIDNRRSERQIDNWYRLARQHIDNHAYTHAREALQNVLQLKPQEARAVHLLSEIDQEEQEYNKLRQDKSQLHRAAMEAWERGDVSTALTKLALVLELDRRAPDSSDAGRSTTYQTFYNQVRSEHDAINNAYAEARKHLADQDFAKALALCDTLLAKYPNHALFQALKFDVGERQRQELSAFIASVDRGLEAEPDLDKKVNLLKDALARNPGEAHFERALRTTQDKRDLVNSIVTRAHLHEEQSLFADALNDWEILSNIYNQYPGLKFEIERLQKRREQQSRAQAKAQFTEQIDRCMQSAHYARALEILQQAQPEFPGDPELAEMETLAQAGLEKADQAQRLMTEGQEFCAQNRFEEGIKLLEQAFHMDEHNAVSRNVLCNALLEQARTLVDADWRAAEELTLRALDLNPGHPQAKSMRTLVLDRKREQFVNEFMSQARKLHAASDLAGALSRIDETLLAYPSEFRLLQMRETLQREIAQSQLRQERRQDLDELRRLQREVESATDRSLTGAFGKRAQSLAGKYPNDEEFASVAKELAARTAIFEAYEPGVRPEESQAKAVQTTPLSSPGAVGEDLPAQQVSSPGREAVAEAPVAPVRVLLRLRPPLVLAAAIDSVRGMARRISWPRLNLQALRDLPFIQSPMAKSQRVLGAACGALVLVIGLALVIPRIVSKPKPKSVAQVAVHVRTIPAGANILINNEAHGSSDVDLRLPVGVYTVTAQMDGYRPAASTLEVRPGTPESLEVTLLPAPLTFRLVTDVAGGKVWLDNHAVGDLNGGQITLSDVAPGKHQLRFATERGEAAFSFEAAQAALPVLGGTISSKGVNTLVVAGFGSRLKVYSSFIPAQLSVDEQPAVELAPAGSELQNIAPGNHQLSVTQASERHTLDIDAGPAPSLSAFVQSNQNIGTLLIVTAEDRVKVFLDGKLQKQTTEAGQLRIANLEPRQYQVRVARDGFQEVPEQKIDVRKGEQARLKFSLQPMARLAVLAIQGAMPGTEVVMDRTSIGTVQPDGSFRYSAVSPGDHSIELRKDRYKARQIQKRFASGSPIALGPAETTLEPMPGELRLTFSPPEADVTLTGNGQALTKIKNGSILNLPSGSYSLTARTSEGLVRSLSVQIVSGESRAVDLALAPGGMSNWEQPEGWTPEKDYFVHRGGNFVLFHTSPTSGTFSFSALLQKGHRLQWVLNYMDDKNYLSFSMDENFFYRSLVRNGQQVETAQFPHKTDKKQFRSLQIRVSGDEIVHQIREGSQWVTLDTWNQPGTELSAGKFGFLIPGKDQVALSNFRHYAELNTR